MKAFIEKKLGALQLKKKEIAEKSEKSQDIAELKRYNADLEQTNSEIKEYEEQLISCTGKLRSTSVAPLNSFYLGKDIKKEADEDDIEYRKAFMNYVTRGEKIPESLEKASQTTMTADVGAVIPQTIVNEIIQKLKESGKIYAAIRKTSIQGGVSYPTSSVIPVAKWMEEGKVAEKEKKSVTSITFGYYKLQCRVSMTIETSVVSLAVFEQQVVEDVYTAMVVAVEKAVISGTGTGQPKGFTLAEGVEAVSISEANVSKYQTYTAARAKMGSSYRSGAVWLLTQTDWDTHIVGMVDTNGQPIARVTVGLDGVPVERLLGIPALLVDEDYIKTFEEAATGDVFGALVNLGYYAFNSNMQMTMRKYFDEELDEWVQKATLIGDGKLLISDAAVVLKKA